MSPVYSGEIEPADPNEDISSLQTGFWTGRGAGLAETVSELPAVRSTRVTALEAAKRGQLPRPQMMEESGIEMPGLEQYEQEHLSAQVPRRAAEERVKAAGLSQALKLPAGEQINESALTMMMDHARAQAQRADVIARGPKGFIPGALDVGTSFLVGALDPINVAAFSIPVLGEARYGMLLASAGESVIGRGAVRGGVGALQGIAGSTALTPLDWAMNTSEGRDYTMANALESIITNAGIGAVMHAGGGAVSDVFRARYPHAVVDEQNQVVGRFRTGEAAAARITALEAEGRTGLQVKPSGLYPHGPGEPAAGEHDGRQLPEAIPGAPGGEARAPGELPAEQAPGGGEGPEAARPAALRPQEPEGKIDQTAAAVHASDAEIAARPSDLESTMGELPYRAKEDAFRATIAKMIGGEMVKTDDLLKTAAKFDPRIAAALERDSFLKALHEDGLTEEPGVFVRDRAVEILRREGIPLEDAAVALEHAVNEMTAEKLGPRGVGHEIEKPAVSEEPGAASLAGAGARPGVAERPGQAREPASAARGSDRAGTAAGDARLVGERISEWRRLVDAKQPWNEPAVLEAAKAARELAEPASLEPEKSLSAAQQAAARVEEQYRSVAEFLPKEERRAFDEAMEAFDRDLESRKEVVRQAAGCLAAAGLGGVV